MTDPTQTVLPESDLETVTSWIEDRFPAAPLDQVAGVPAGVVALENQLDDQDDDRRVVVTHN